MLEIVKEMYPDSYKRRLERIDQHIAAKSKK